jgi:hypothetical protein
VRGRCSRGDELKKLRQGLALLITNPELATRPCGDCQKWVFLDKIQGERYDTDERGGKIMTRNGKRVERGTALPPCQTCPKKSPEQAKDYELNNRNIRMYEMYLKSQATCGLCLGDLAHDPVVQRDFAIIHQIVTMVRDSRAEMMAMRGALL